MDFETVIKIVIMAVAAVGIPVGAYAAVAATRSIWGRQQPDRESATELSALKDRVHELEAMQTRMMELEERLDFAERMLVQNREPGRLPEAKEVR
jgi:Tfp pilus assembly protein PilO